MANVHVKRPIIGISMGDPFGNGPEITVSALSDASVYTRCRPLVVGDYTTVLVIEHNLDVIKVADYIVDLGPEGGSGGGQIVACGTPEQIAACPESFTGQYLKKMLK